MACAASPFAARSDQNRSTCAHSDARKRAGAMLSSTVAMVLCYWTCGGEMQSRSTMLRSAQLSSLFYGRSLWRWLWPCRPCGSIAAFFPAPSHMSRRPAAVSARGPRLNDLWGTQPRLETKANTGCSYMAIFDRRLGPASARETRGRTRSSTGQWLCNDPYR